MVTAPISTGVRARLSETLLESPLTVILVIPQIDQVPTPDFTIDATKFAVNALTEITSANADGVGAVPTGNANVDTPLARAAYDFIESGANVHVFALPFAVSTGDNASQRAVKVVSAVNTTLGKAAERAKLPDAAADVIVVPRECGVGSAANSVVTELETVCAQSHMGCVALVDAGDVVAGPDARPVAANPTMASVQTWAGNNRNLAIYAFSNRGDVTHYDGMWGSVIAAGHLARYTSQRGIWAHPFNLRDPALGVGATAPLRVFDPGDGSSDAVALDRQHYLGSIIQYEGVDYVWGGKSYAAARDARQWMSNHVVTNRMLRRSRRTMARFLVDRAKGSTLESLRLSLERPLVNIYVPNAVQDVQVREPSISSGHVSAIVDVGFYEFVESVSLLAEVYLAEVA